MILLILLVLAAVIIVYSVVKGTIGSSSEKMDKTTTCLYKVDLEIIDSCYTDLEPDDPIISDSLEIKVKNKNDFDYGEGYFMVKVLRQGSTDKEEPTYPGGSLYGLEEREFIIGIDDPGQADKFIFIPRITGPEGFDCYDRAVEFTSKPCV